MLSIIAIRRRLRRTRGGLSVALAVMALGCAVAVHHGVPDDLGMHHSMDASIAVCLAVLSVAAAAAVVALGIAWVRGLPKATSDAPVRSRVLGGPRVSAARDGPLFIHLCVLRR